MDPIGRTPTWRLVGALCASFSLAACADFYEGAGVTETEEAPGDTSDGLPTFDGDSELGPEHRAPGFAFHYVIDVSDGAYAQHAIKRGIEVFNERVALEPGDPDFIDLDQEPTIAVLLPRRTESTVIGINGGPDYNHFERADMELEGTTFDVHFIGPWCAGPGDSKIDAMRKVRDDVAGLDWGYRLTCKDSAGYSLVDGGGGHTIRLDVEECDHAGAFHFWCMNIEGGGRSIIDIGSASPYVDFERVTGDNDVHMHLIRLHQDDVLFAPGDFPFWGVSSWHTRVHVHGYYSDLPWNSEHHFYLREEPYGDMTYEYVHCDRAGGQIMQKADREPGMSGAPQGPLRGGRTDPGTNYYREFRGIARSGRWAGKASSFFTQFSSHQAMDFERCVVAALETDNCRRNWPPPDPYGDIADEEFNFTVGGTSWTHFGNQSDAPQPSTGPHPGYLNGPIRMRRCVWYLRRPTKDLLGFRAAPSVDVEDCGFFTDVPTAPAWDTGGAYMPGSRSVIGIATSGRGSIFAASHLIGSFRWVGNCKPTHVAVLAQAPFNISPSEVQIPLVKIGTNRVTVGSADQDVVFDRFTGDAYQAGTDPVGLVVQ